MNTKHVWRLEDPQTDLAWDVVERADGSYHLPDDVPCGAQLHCTRRTVPAWQVGDILQNRRWPDVQHVLLTIEETGYLWTYPQYVETSDENKVWHSGNSSDPFYEDGWTLVGKKAIML